MIEDPLFYLAAIPAVLLAGISKGGFGGGVAMLAVPLMSLVISPLAATAVMLPILCSIDLIGIWAYWRQWDSKKVLLLGVSALVGIAIGSFSFSLLNPAFIRLMIGVIAVVFALQHFWKPLSQTAGGLKDNRVKGAICGVIAGFTSFTAHAGGPPLYFYLLPMKLPRTMYHATTVVFFLMVNYLKLVPYTWLGLFSKEVLMTSAVLAPLAVIGALGGVWLHKRISDKYFYVLCYGFLLLTGAKLVYDGFSELL